MPFPFRLIFKILSVIVALGIIVCVLILGGAAYFNAPPESYRPDFTHGENAMRLEEDGTLHLEIKSG